MKRTRTAAALVCFFCLALTLTACSPKELAKKAILGVADAMGLRDDESDDDDTGEHLYAQTGGDVTFPETMDTDSARVVSIAEDGVMYVSFRAIEGRSSDYFYAGGTSVTITSYATSDAPSGYYQHYKVALWELSDDQEQTTYVQGSTAYFLVDGTCQQYTVTGLTAGKQYKVYISYDTSTYYVTGGVKVEGLGSEELNTYGEDATTAG